MLVPCVGSGGAAGEGCGASPSRRSLAVLFRMRDGEQHVSPSTRADALAIVCARLRALGMGGKVSAFGARLRVVLPYLRQDDERRRAIEQIGATGQLHFYDWEPSLFGREHRIGGHPGASAPAGPLSRARREWRGAGRNPDDPANDRLIRSGAFPTARGAAKLASRALFDTAIVSERAIGNDGRIVQGLAPGWYALRNRPALSGADIVNPRQGMEFGVPSVTFSFTKEGRVAFEQVTRAIARRGRARAKGPVTSRAAEELSGHFALVFDGEVKTRPIINFAENPDGIDGRTGAQISGGFASVRDARDLAIILRIGALPIDLVLVRQRLLGS